MRCGRFSHIVSSEAVPAVALGAAEIAEELLPSGETVGAVCLIVESAHRPPGLVDQAPTLIGPKGLFSRRKHRRKRADFGRIGVVGDAGQPHGSSGGLCRHFEGGSAEVRQKARSIFAEPASKRRRRRRRRRIFFAYIYKKEKRMCCLDPQVPVPYKENWCSKPSSYVSMVEGHF